MNGLYEHKNYARVNLGAIVSNFHLLSRKIKEKTPNAIPICVVKANAYGHGLKECVSALLSAGAEFFAVSDVSEAIEVRRLSPSASILILDYTVPSSAPLLYKHNIIQAVFDTEYAEKLSSAMRMAKNTGEIPQNASLRLHIKLNTGMNRLGFSVCDGELDSIAEELLALSSLDGISLEGVFSHFACADMLGVDMSERQTELFFRAVSLLKERGLNLKTHISNSAATIRFGSAGFDYARIGISLYGLSPSSEVRQEGLIPAMQLFCRVAQVRELAKGQSVSYGATYTAERDMKIAVISIGYADGLIRACSGGEVIINGRRAKIIGRICMDQSIVELGDIEAKEGDIVTVYDESGENIEALASGAGTISYELITLLGSRVFREYKKYDE